MDAVASIQHHGRVDVYKAVAHTDALVSWAKPEKYQRPFSPLCPVVTRQVPS
jgi:hypothetical protein